VLGGLGEVWIVWVEWCCLFVFVWVSVVEIDFGVCCGGWGR